MGTEALQIRDETPLGSATNRVAVVGPATADAGPRKRQRRDRNAGDEQRMDREQQRRQTDYGDLRADDAGHVGEHVRGAKRGLLLRAHQPVVKRGRFQRFQVEPDRLPRPASPAPLGPRAGQQPISVHGGGRARIWPATPDATPDPSAPVAAADRTGPRRGPTYQRSPSGDQPAPRPRVYVAGSRWTRARRL